MERLLLLLGLLRKNEMHGYQLYEFIERDLSVCTDLKKPTAYYLLNKMSEDGWIIEEQSQEGNRPPRKVFRLTAEGENAYQRLLRENLATYASTTFAGDISLAFLDDLPIEESLRLLAQRRSALASALQTTQAAPQHHGSLQLVIEHQIRHLSSELNWLEEIITRLTAQSV